MGRGRNVLRRKLLKATQAEKEKLDSEMALHKLSHTVLKIIIYLNEMIEEYCTNIKIELKNELINHGKKRIEFSRLAIDLYSHQQLRPGSDVHVLSLLPIENEYSAAGARADIFYQKVREGLDIQDAEFEKVREFTKLGQDDARALKTRAKEDPIGLVTEMEGAKIKAEEIKREMESLQAEWNAVKDELNSGIDDCNRQMRELLQDVIAHGLGPGEE